MKNTSLLAAIVLAASLSAAFAATTPPSPQASIDPACDPTDSLRIRLVVKVLANGKTDLEGACVTIQRGNRESEITTDEDGRCAISVRRGAEFTGTVSMPGYDTVKFHRNLGDGVDWATVKIHLYKKELSNSLVAEFRTGKTADLENPERDFARFIFDVNYYKGHTPIDNAVIVLSRPDGKVARRLHVDEDGRVETLVREGNKLDVKVRAPGYADYNTRLAPGLKATSRRVVVNLRKKL